MTNASDVLSTDNDPLVEAYVITSTVVVRMVVAAQCSSTAVKQASMLWSTWSVGVIGVIGTWSYLGVIGP